LAHHLTPSRRRFPPRDFLLPDGFFRAEIFLGALFFTVPVSQRLVSALFFLFIATFLRGSRGLALGRSFASAYLLAFAIVFR
jgi:hypothetical protein